MQDKTFLGRTKHSYAGQSILMQDKTFLGRTKHSYAGQSILRQDKTFLIFAEKCASGQCLALAAARAVLEFCMPRRLIDK